MVKINDIKKKITAVKNITWHYIILTLSTKYSELNKDMEYAVQRNQFRFETTENGTETSSKPKKASFCVSIEPKQIKANRNKPKRTTLYVS